MLFNSIDFLIFFPIVVMIYYVFQKIYMYLLLLVASYYFYMSWNAEYALLLLFSTTVTYLASRGIGWVDESDKEMKLQKKTAKKLFVAGSLIANLLILFFFKYANFSIDSINMVLRALHLSVIERKFDVLLPVGISFYIVSDE